MIKLIATDIDGTLVKEGAPTLEQEMVEVIHELVASGVIFTAASGRSLISMEGLFEPVKEEIHYIACNGTLIGKYHDMMVTEAMGAEELREMVRELKQDPNAIPFFTTADNMYCETDTPKELCDWLVDGYHEKLTIVEDLADHTEGVVKLSIYAKDRDAKHAFLDFRNKWTGPLATNVSGETWVDVYRKGFHKGSAVRRMQELLGITPEETLTIGDQQNDVEMIKAAYHSYAIGNAIPEVKKAARFLADTNENQGALKVFREVLRKNAEDNASEA